jgi:hypothetical protein
MSMSVSIFTNHHRRPVIDGWQLTEAERAQFDYLDWAAIDRGEESASFFRYAGSLYDLGEFTANWGLSRNSGLPDHLKGWDGYMSDSAFSATVVKYVEDGEAVVVGRVIS